MSYKLRVKTSFQNFKINYPLFVLLVFLQASALFVPVQGAPSADPKDALKAASEALEQATNIAFTFPAGTYKIYLLEKLILLQHRAGNAISAEKIIQHAIPTIEELKKELSSTYADISNPSDLMRRVPNELTMNVPYMFFLLMRIADLQINIGNSTGALATLQKATELVNDICKDLQKIGCLEKIAVLQARAGDRAGSASTLQDIARLKGDVYFQIHSILAVAQAQAEKGQKDLALANLNQALSKVDDSGTFPYLDKILREASLVTARLGSNDLLEELLKKAFVAIDREAKRRSFSAETAKAMVLVDISKVQPLDRARQSIRRALSLAQTIPDGTLKSSVYMEITVAQALLNDLRGARESFGQIDDDEHNRGYRGMAAPYLAEAMTRAGEVDEALKLVNEVSDADQARWLRILVAVGVAKAERGDIEGAMRISQRIAKWVDSSQRILSAVGRQKAKIGPFHEALAWAKTQPPGSAQMYALMGVAEGLLDKVTITEGS